MIYNFLCEDCNKEEEHDYAHYEDAISSPPSCKCGKKMVKTITRRIQRGIIRRRTIGKRGEENYRQAVEEGRLPPE